MGFKKLISILFVYFILSIEVAMAAECVVLIHGFGRSSFSMSKISHNLQANGYKTINIDYPSRKYTLNDLINNHITPQIDDKIDNCSKIHFVGYSMGGIITRYILEHHRPENLGKVIFLGTPNSGAEVVNVLGKYKWFKKLFGPAVQQLAIGSSFWDQIPNNVDYESGVISGNFSINPITSLFMIKGDDDGTISVESSKIEGMKEQLVLPVTHKMLLNSQRVVEEIEHFIRKGQFRPLHSFDLFP